MWPMSLKKSTRAVAITRWDGPAAVDSCADEIAVEEPLEIRVGGQSVAVVMRTPGHDRELTAGFLITDFAPDRGRARHGLLPGRPR
jgi:FdhD protein